MHLYRPSQHELSQVTGLPVTELANQTAPRNARIARGAWCTGVMALRSQKELWPDMIPTALRGSAQHGHRTVQLEHRITATDDRVYDISKPANFLKAKPDDIPAIDIETHAAAIAGSEAFTKIHAYRLGAIALIDEENGDTYPSLHHVSQGQEGETLGREVAVGSGDWNVALFSVIRIAQSTGLAEV